MKLPHLIIIFVLIMMPIVIVSSEYINTQLNIMKTEELYDSRLLNSTYDATKAFQINTINTVNYFAENRAQNMENAVNTFFYSMATSFNFSGSKSDIIKEYIPAAVMTMYDGYYIYEPFTNTLTNLDATVEEEYKNNRTIRGLKPFVSYTCNYIDGNTKYMITYSLDNYIVIDEFKNNEHNVDKGYLINGITKGGTSGNETYTYKGVTFTKNNTEVLSEYLGESYGNKMYYYTVEDGTKYYYIGNNTNGSQTPNGDDKIAYINDGGSFTYTISNYANNVEEFTKYYNKIFKNNSAYLYYKNAYEFYDEWGEKLQNLTIGKIDNNYPTYKDYEFIDVGNIFDDTKNIEDPDSNFNRHRADVIRAIITTNLKTAISGFSKYSTTGEEFIMPKISESDWELLENNICMVTFFQGMRIKGKLYNNYAVVVNDLNKEFVSEKDIYILKKDKTYTNVNDSSLLNTGTIEDERNAGVLRVNIRQRRDQEGKYFNPISYIDSNGNYSPYLQSYTALAGNTYLNSLGNKTLGQYISDLSGGEDTPQGILKRTYFTALAREKYCSYKSYD